MNGDEQRLTSNSSGERWHILVNNGEWRRATEWRVVEKNGMASGGEKWSGKGWRMKTNLEHEYIDWSARENYILDENFYDI